LPAFTNLEPVEFTATLAAGTVVGAVGATVVVVVVDVVVVVVVVNE
jgi:hypothetical protein